MSSTRAALRCANSSLASCIVISAALVAISAPGREPLTAANGTTDKVGRLGENVYQTPANQIITPAGITVELPRMRPQALALSPDGKLLVTSGKTTDLVVIDPQSGKILDKVPLHNSQDPKKKKEEAEKNPDMPAEKNPDLPADNPDMPSEKKEADKKAEADKKNATQVKPDTSAQLSFTGLIFSPDGSRIYLSNVNGDIKVFGVANQKVTALKTLKLPEAKAPSERRRSPPGLPFHATAGTFTWSAT